MTANNKVRVSVVTSVCALEFETEMQIDKLVHPKLWFKYSQFTEKLKDIRNCEGRVYGSVHDIHYRHLYVNLEEAINLVFKEQNTSDKGYDFVNTTDLSIA